MPANTREITLDNGLRVTLIHQPDADNASALIQFDVGSHDEPEAYPGLAHLLEHLLFAGGRDFAGEERLLIWAQRVGGQVNATTRLRQSAYFFEVPAPLFHDGLQRMRDMVLHPELALSAIAQEISVIDAENNMIQQHAPSQQEAAILHTASAPACFRRFHVGSAGHFGTALPALHEAITRFHQRYYSPANARLWLQGPDALDEMESRARQFMADARRGHPNRVAAEIRLSPFPTLRLQSSSLPAFWYCPLITLTTAEQQHSVALFRAFLLDEAPGGLLATLRGRRLAENVDIKWLYRDAENGWLALIFTSTKPDEVNALLASWITALQKTDADQQRHYYQLAQRRFAALSPLESLRQRAFGFAPTGSFADFHHLCAQLLAARVARLVCSPQPVTTRITTQGFHLPLAPASLAALSAEAAIFTFHPQKNADDPQALPADIRPRPPLWLRGAREAITLIVRPAPRHNLLPENAEGIRLALQPLFGVLRHRGGDGEWQPVQGTWQLTLQLPGDLSLTEAFLGTILRYLATPPTARVVSDETIAVRYLLQALPQRLATSFTPNWVAALAGGDDAQFDLIARYLGLLNNPMQTGNSPPPALTENPSTSTYHSDDNALLLFIPLPQASSLTALRVLARVYEPRFFHWLRSEMQIGYIVRCCYMRCVDEEGLLFTLQSPGLSVAELQRLCQVFLDQFELPDPTLFSQLKTELAHQLPANITPAEKALMALRRSHGLPEMTSLTLSDLTYSELLSLHTSLRNERHRWTILSNEADIA